VAAHRERLLNAATVVATAVAIAVVGVRLYGAQSKKEVLKQVHDWRSYAAVGHREGPSNAPVTIVDFSDFQCPYCQKASQYLDKARQRYPEQLAVVYRHFPIHDHAAEAAVGAECASEQQRFSEYRRLLFAHPESIGVKSITAFARDAGVDTVRFSRCLADPDRRRTVLRDSAAGVLLGIRGTPTLLINQLKVTGFPSDTTMDRYIKEFLATTGEGR
jgi:protein-disulfide isomerase